MNLLKAALYDPTTAVNKVTTAALAMTALDTTNLRLAITVPAHGMVRFRLRGVLHGATTVPAILLGVMNGATVIGRAAPLGQAGATAVATALIPVEVDFTSTGLTPGAMNVDAAYGVETLVAATGLKYGGPNNTTANDAFGAFVFEAWDPQPQTANSTLAVDANGRVDVSKVLGTAQTAGDLKASLNTLQADTDDIQTRLPAALVGGRMDSSVGAMAANVLTAAAINAAALNGKGDWMVTYTQPAGFLAATFPAGTVANTTNITAGTITTATNLTNAPTAGDFTAAMKTSLNAATPASVTGSVGSVTGLTAANLDVAVSTRLASAGYTVPPTVGAIRAEIDANSVGLASIFSRTDVATSTRLASASYTVPPTDVQNAAAVLAAAVEGSTTVAQMLRGYASALLGKASGLDLNTPKYRDLADTKNRIDATTDASGNRTAVTLDLT